MTHTDKQSDGIQVKKVKRETLPEKIISEITSLIESGQLKQGSKLPSEREFARMLGVGRPTLREALKALSVLGIIVNKQGEGNFLSDDYRSWPSEPLSIFFSIKKGALIDIYEARKGIEMQAVALAAKRRTPEDLENMDQALKMMRQSKHELDLYYRYDMDFHISIAVAAQNEILIDLIKKIHKVSFDTRNVLWRTADHVKMDVNQDLAKHEELMWLITEGNAKAASKHAGQHLDMVLQRLKKGVTREDISAELST